jgi:hypothetical protein
MKRTPWLRLADVGYRLANRRTLTGLAVVVAAMFSFAQETSAGQAPVALGSAGRFAVLAGSGVSSIPTSTIRGDVGLSPAARSKLTGLTGPEVVGAIFAADDGGAVAVMLTQSKSDLNVAYNDAAGRTLAPVDVSDANLGGRTLAPGLYRSSGTLGLTGALTLDAQGDTNGVFIFQVASELYTAPASQVVLSGGTKTANVFWQVGSSGTLGSYSVFKGTILADQSISMNTGATLDGRALAMIGAVTMDSSIVTSPAPRPRPPSFGPLRRPSANSVTVVITNTPGFALTLETSADLENWTIFTTSYTTESPTTFDDATASGEPHRFYRAFYP